MVRDWFLYTALAAFLFAAPGISCGSRNPPAQIKKLEEIAQEGTPFYPAKEMQAYAQLIADGEKDVFVRAKAVYDAVITDGISFDRNPLDRKNGTKTAAQVFEDRKGQCIELTNLYLALSRAAGVHSYALTVKVSGWEKAAAGDHVIAGFDYGNRKVLVDLGVPFFDPKEGELEKYHNHDYKNAVLVSDQKFLAINDINTGACFNEQNRYSEAVKALERAVAVWPNAFAYTNLGRAYSGLNQIDKAIETYKKSLELDNSISTTWNNIGCIYARQENYREAVKYFERALQCNPDDPSAQQHLAVARMMLQQGNK